MSRISYTRPSSYNLPLSKKNSKYSELPNLDLRAEASGGMAFLLRVMSGSEQSSDKISRLNDTENARRAFRMELDNILRRVEAEDEELQSLVERIYDTSFPESQKFLKNPTKESLVKAHTDSICRLLSGLSSQGVPVTRLLLEVVTKHGTDGVREPLLTLLEMVRPLLANKDIPDFTSDDLLDAIDNQWHSGTSVTSESSSAAAIWGYTAAASSKISTSSCHGHCRSLASTAKLSPGSRASHGLTKPTLSSSTSLPNIHKSIEEKTGTAQFLGAEFSASRPWMTIAHKTPLTLPFLQSFSDDSNFASNSCSPRPLTHGSLGKSEDLKNTPSNKGEDHREKNVKLTFEACGIPEVLQPLEPEHRESEQARLDPKASESGIPEVLLLRELDHSGEEQAGLDQKFTCESGILPEVNLQPDFLREDHWEEQLGLDQKLPSESAIPESLLQPVQEDLELGEECQGLDQTLTALMHGVSGDVKLQLEPEADSHEEKSSESPVDLVPTSGTPASNLEISSPQIGGLDCPVASVTCDGEAQCDAVDRCIPTVKGFDNEGKDKPNLVEIGNLEDFVTELSVSKFQGAQDIISCCKGIDEQGLAPGFHEDSPSMNDPAQQLLLDGPQLSITSTDFSPEEGIQQNFEDSAENLWYPFVQVPQQVQSLLGTADNREDPLKLVVPSDTRLRSSVGESELASGDSDKSTSVMFPTESADQHHTADSLLSSSSNSHSTGTVDDDEDITAVNLGNVQSVSADHENLVSDDESKFSSTVFPTESADQQHHTVDSWLSSSSNSHSTGRVDDDDEDIMAVNLGSVQSDSADHKNLADDESNSNVFPTESTEHHTADSLLSSSSLHPTGVDDENMAANLGIALQDSADQNLLADDESNSNSNSNSQSMVVPTMSESSATREEIELGKFYRTTKLKGKICWWGCCFRPSSVS